MTLTRSGLCSSPADRLDFGSPTPTVAVPSPGGSFSRCLFAEAVYRAAWISTGDAGKEGVGGMQALFSCVRRFPKPGLCFWGRHPRWD